MRRLFSTASGKGMKFLLAILVIFVILDGVLTHFLVDGGLAREGNPFLEPLVGEAGFIVLKVVGSLICALILWDIYRHFPKVGTTATRCAVMAYGFIVVWNTSLFLLS